MSYKPEEITDAFNRIVELRSQRDELLAALKHAQEALYWHKGENFEIDGRQARDVIAQAIAKAEGEYTLTPEQWKLMQERAP